MVLNHLVLQEVEVYSDLQELHTEEEEKRRVGAIPSGE